MLRQTVKKYSKTSLYHHHREGELWRYDFGDRLMFGIMSVICLNSKT